MSDELVKRLHHGIGDAVRDYALMQEAAARIKALEARARDAEAERDALREALEEARGLILGANHGPTRYPRAFALLLGEVDRGEARDG